VFKVRGKYYASQQMCPQRRTFGMSDSLIGESGDLAGAYHKRNSPPPGGVVADEKKDAGAGSCSNDTSMSIATFKAEERGDGWVYLKVWDGKVEGY
jgi:nitrite reductase (NAD(P)H)